MTGFNPSRGLDGLLADSLAALFSVHGLPRLREGMAWLERTAADSPERLHVGELRRR